MLSDRDVREGIKEYSNWPTIPQLYVDGEFQGGCDIVKEMYASGELQQAARARGRPQDVAVPTVTVTDEAAVLLRDAIRSQGGELHVAIDAGFKHSLSLGAARGARDRGDEQRPHDPVRPRVGSCARMVS